MGQKVHATGFRLGQSNTKDKGWKNVWFNRRWNSQQGQRAQSAYWGEHFLRDLLQKKGFIFVKASLEIKEAGLSNQTLSQLHTDFKQWQSAESTDSKNKHTNGTEVYSWRVEVLAQPFLVNWKKNKQRWNQEDLDEWLVDDSEKVVTFPAPEPNEESIQGLKYLQTQVQISTQYPVQTKAWEDQLEEDWAQIWSTDLNITNPIRGARNKKQENKKARGCPTFKALANKIRHELNHPVEIEIKVVDALSSSAAFIQTALWHQAKTKKPLNWKRAFESVFKNRSQGVKPTAYRIWSSGRHSGAEMARVEKVQEGNLSFQRIKDPVDYALGERLFKYGLISIKVWMLSPKLRPYGTFKIQSYS